MSAESPSTPYAGARPAQRARPDSPGSPVSAFRPPATEAGGRTIQTRTGRRPAVLFVALLAAAACDDSGTEPAEEAGAVAQIAIVSGGDQVGEAGSTLPLPLTVRLSDSADRPVAGVLVSWFAVHGGRVSSQGSTTDSNGLASVQRILGLNAGDYVTRATLPDADGIRREAVFTSIALVQGAYRMTASVSARTDTVFATVAHRVDVRDHLDRPVSGVRVAWTLLSGAGALAPASSTTDVQGFAEALHTLGFRVGQQAVLAKVSGLPDVAFAVSATAGNPVAMDAVGGPTGLGKVGEVTQLAVRVADAYGNPTLGRAVDWAVTGGGGSIGAVSFSDASGVARAHRVLGSEAATQTTTATLRDAPGVPPVVFTSVAVNELVTIFERYYYYYGYFSYFSPDSVEVAVDGRVGWSWPCEFCTSSQHNVVFEDDPSEPASSATSEAGAHIRTFDAPGTYRYRCTLHSTSFTGGEVGVVKVL